MTSRVARSFGVPGLLISLVVFAACGGNVVVEGDPGGGGGGSGASGGGGPGPGVTSSTAAGPSTTVAGGGGGLSCEAYCADVIEHCQDGQAQYGDMGWCQAVCAHLPVGTLGDTSGNTLGCRAYHAGVPAQMDPQTHCPHAGPLGAFVCGEDCESFCLIAVATCGNQPTPPYEGQEHCLKECSLFVGTDMVPYNTTVTSGNSLACRMYHLTVAASGADNAQVHCPHVAAISDPCQ
jgi:hypothetical protein